MKMSFEKARFISVVLSPKDFPSAHITLAVKGKVFPFGCVGRHDTDNSSIALQAWECLCKLLRKSVKP